MKKYNQKIVDSLNKNKFRRLLPDLITSGLVAGAITCITASCIAIKEGRIIPALIALTASAAIGGAAVGLMTYGKDEELYQEAVRRKRRAGDTDPRASQRGLRFLHALGGAL